MTLNQFRLAIRLSLPLAAAVALCVAATSPALRAIPGALAKRWKRPAPPAVPGYRARIAFPDIRDHLLLSPTPGRLDVHATADWQASSAEEPHWEVPFLEVRRMGPSRPKEDKENDEEFEEVWAREYTDLAWESVPGQVHRHDFRETLQLPPGSYRVLWGIRRHDPGRDESGLPVPIPAPSSNSRSFRAVVR
jgi:hypothetical protein